MASRQAISRSIERSNSLSAFIHPAFRLYFLGQLVSVSGTWMQSVAQQIVVYQLTGSDLALGLVACAQGLPALFLTPLGGVIVERVSRRKVLICTQSAMMILAFIMALLQFTNSLQIWHIAALSIGLGVAQAIDAPARQTFVIEMVGREHLSSGIAMNSIMFNAARVFGPALGGIALKTVGPSWCFFLNGLSFLAVIVSLVIMIVPAAQSLPGRLSFWRPLIEGFRFSRDHETIRPLLLLSTAISVFGITYGVLITPFADQVLGNTEIGTSALLAAQGIGAIVSGIVVARANGSGRRGRMMVSLAIAGPIMIICLAFTSVLSHYLSWCVFLHPQAELEYICATAFIPPFGYALALLLAAVASYSLTCVFILMNTLLQTEVPDVFRGRVLALYSLTFFGFTPFSSLAIGLIAQLTSTVAAILLYGVICLTGVLLIAARSPSLSKMA